MTAGRAKFLEHLRSKCGLGLGQLIHTMAPLWSAQARLRFIQAGSPASPNRRLCSGGCRGKDLDSCRLHQMLFEERDGPFPSEFCGVFVVTGRRVVVEAVIHALIDMRVENLFVVRECLFEWSSAGKNPLVQ